MGDLVTTATVWAEQAKAVDWLLSQCALLVLAYLLAGNPVAKCRDFSLFFLILMQQLVAQTLTAGGEGAARSRFGLGVVSAFGNRESLLMAAHQLAQKVLDEPKGGHGGADRISPVRLSIWNSLKNNGICMTCPHRMAEITGGLRA